MVEVRKIVKERNLAIEDFASLVGTSIRSIRKYENDDPGIRQDTKDRIERGIEMLIASGIVWPEQHNPFDWLSTGWRRGEYFKCNRKFEMFIKAYKKVHSLN